MGEDYLRLAFGVNCIVSMRMSTDDENFVDKIQFNIVFNNEEDKKNSEE